MATISNTPRPGYVFDVTDNVWYPIGTGSHNHSEIPSTIVDAKGDIITASAADTPARLAVGNNGETLVADSSTSTGLRYKEDYAAGKNKIINGDFGIWQRGTSFTSPSSAYTADRFVANAVTSDVVSQQTFTPGNTITGYEPQYFLRYATSANAGTRYFFQKIEDVRTFAGQTVVFSFWAKVNSGTATLTTYFYQQFGSGGSADVQSTSGTQTVTTSWQRFSFSITMPSVSGKTIGAGSLVQAAFSFTDISKNLDLWGFQLEESSVATAFNTATGTLQGELAACQRYYERINWDAATGYATFGQGAAQTSTNARTLIPFQVQKRVRPTAIDYPTISTNFRVLDFVDNIVGAPSAVSFDANQTSTSVGYLNWTTSGATGNRVYLVTGNNSASAYLGWSAEL